MSKQNQIKSNKKADITRQDELSAFETTDSQPKGNKSMSTVAQTTEIVKFNNQELLTLKIGEIIYTAIRPIVEGMGLNWGSQSAKLKNPKFNCCDIETVAQDGKIRTMLCMPIKKLNGWLFSINPEKVKPEIKDDVIAYQEECFEALYNYWHKGIAVNPRRLTISVEQQKAIRFAVAKRANGVRPHFQTVYTALYREFDIPRYTELLASDFDEAIKFIQSVNLTPQIEDKEFTMLDGKSTNAVMDYLFSLRREITRLGGKIPEFNLSNEIIAQGIITRMIQGNRMMLSFDMESGARIKFIPQDHWVITEDNIANIIGDADGVKKSRLPEIMNALIGRMGFSR